MIPAHAATLRSLSQPQAMLLRSRLARERLLPDHPKGSVPTPDSLAEDCVAARLTQAEVVLVLASDTSDQVLQIVEHLIRQPIYQCARGETGEVLHNIRGELLVTPIGARRGAPVPADVTGSPPADIRRLRGAARRVDDRVIVAVVPNPKRPGSSAHARFQLYRVGMTMEEATRIGITRADIRWDSMKGFIALETPEQAAVTLRVANIESEPRPEDPAEDDL